MKPSDQRYKVRRHAAPPRAQATGNGAVAPPGHAEEIVRPAPKLPESSYADVPEAYSSMQNYLLNANLKSQPLKVYIDNFDGYYDGDIVQLWVDGNSQGDHVITPTEAANSLVTLEVPADLRTEGKEHVLQYLLQSGIIGPDGETPSLPLRFLTDYTPPGNPSLGRLEFDPVIQEQGLTSATLNTLGDKITAEIPNYFGAADGDLIEPELALHMGNGVPVKATPVRIPPGDTDKKKTVEFTRQQIVQNGDGVTEFRYYVTDLAGNRSQMSFVSLIDVFVSGAISDLQAPAVPLYDVHQLLGEADARSPILVDIPGNAKLAANDKIVAYWGNIALAEVPVTDTNLPVILSIAVPYPVVQAAGDGTIQVSYKAYRAGKLLGESPSTNVQVSLEQPGGVDSDPQTGENEGLGQPVVHAASWKTGDAVNVISVKDSSSDATVIIPWLNTATPPAASFNRGDRIQVFYAGAALPDTYEVSEPDVTAAKDLSIALPANVIAQYGSGTLPVYYVAARTVGTGVDNSSMSIHADVTVESAGDLPGGGDPLIVPAFDVPYISYTYAQAGVGVTIPDYINKKVGDKVTIRFSANFNIDGSGVDMPHASYTDSRRVGPDDLGNTMAFKIPSTTALYLYPLAQAHLSFTAENAFGSASSPAANIRCDTRANNNPPDDRDKP